MFHKRNGLVKYSDPKGALLQCLKNNLNLRITTDHTTVGVDASYTVYVCGFWAKYALF